MNIHVYEVNTYDAYFGKCWLAFMEQTQLSDEDCIWLLWQKTEEIDPDISLDIVKLEYDRERSRHTFLEVSKEYALSRIAFFLQRIKKYPDPFEEHPHDALNQIFIFFQRLETSSDVQFFILSNSSIFLYVYIKDLKHKALFYWIDPE